MHTFTVTDEERRMIITALRIFEDEWVTDKPGDEEYFTKVLALAKRLETNE